MLRVLREIADLHGLLLIVDEIATGFGRTGKLFAVEWAQVDPDVMCVGKALTGGYLSLAAMMCTPRVAGALGSGGGVRSALLHGPTFMGNPLACAVACASLDLLAGPAGAGSASAPWRAQVARLERGLRAALEPARELAGVKDVRVLGGVGVIQLHEPVHVAEVTRVAVEHGAWVRPFRDLVYVMPPYICTDDDLRVLGSALTAAVGASPWRLTATPTRLPEATDTARRARRSWETWLAARARVRAARGMQRTDNSRGPLTDLASNDYLGLGTHPEVREAAAAAVREYGAGAAASRVATGTLPVHRELEERCAGTPDGPRRWSFPAATPRTSACSAPSAGREACSSSTPTPTPA